MVTPAKYVFMDFYHFISFLLSQYKQICFFNGVLLVYQNLYRYLNIYAIKQSWLWMDMDLTIYSY